MTKAKTVYTVTVSAHLSLSKSELHEAIVDLFYTAASRGGKDGQVFHKTWGSVDMRCVESDAVDLIPFDLQVELLQAAMDLAGSHGFYQLQDLISNDLFGRDAKTLELTKDLFTLVEPFLPFLEMALAMVEDVEA